MSKQQPVYDEKIDNYRFQLYADGTFLVNGTKKDWYKRDSVPWIPAKRKTFRSLCKQCIREGDYD